MAWWKLSGTSRNLAQGTPTESLRPHSEFRASPAAVGRVDYEAGTSAQRKCNMRHASLCEEGFTGETRHKFYRL
eukprot:CAMPEP_0204217038 /NCGR_PEP_ID=MMETSP0361-20130328/78621_1 /ASSEMBLY_ACC=CAM_ASM_000343 /TAXON_ID=268821 /ORGANISM="Scrippsiella Hangoei, Strain SHTV-5" /LENGTH=73 /DNA_ID=CAMNT_0051181991 /DNA_START=158 /DNA_END=376 /DNA_ORIENTATION=-